MMYDQLVRNAAVVLTFLSAPLLAQTSRDTPAEVVQAFHAALAAGDSSGALALLTPDVVVYEAGGAEVSRKEFRSHHLSADIEFTQGTTRQVTDQRSDQSGDVAWVLSASTTTGTFRGRPINSRGVETMILRRTEEGWRITHIHWSSRRSRGG